MKFVFKLWWSQVFQPCNSICLKFIGLGSVYSLPAFKTKLLILWNKHKTSRKFDFYIQVKNVTDSILYFESKDFKIILYSIKIIQTFGMKPSHCIKKINLELTSSELLIISFWYNFRFKLEITQKMLQVYSNLLIKSQMMLNSQCWEKDFDNHQDPFQHH